MSNWYTTRESIKRAISVVGTAEDTLIDEHVAAASREMESKLMVTPAFIPKTQTRLFRWPQDADVAPQHRERYALFVDAPLLALTSIKANSGAGADFASETFLEPINDGPPYTRIEIDKATADANAVFEVGDTDQRAIHVEALWGLANATTPGGTVRSAAGIDDSVTALLVSDGSVIGVGATALIGSEQVFIGEVVSAAEENDDLLDMVGDLAATKSVVAVTVDDGSRYNVGERILIDSEQMQIEAISVNVLTVLRAVNGSVLAAHLDNAPISVFRTCTIVRGVNGTTAAAHALTAAIVTYAIPEDAAALCRAIAIFNYQQDKSGQTGVVGAGEAAVRVSPKALRNLWDGVLNGYRWGTARSFFG